MPAERLFGLNSDPEVMRYLTGGKATPWEKIQDEIIPAHIAMYEQFRVSCPPQTGTRCRLSQQAKVSGAR